VRYETSEVMVRKNARAAVAAAGELLDRGDVGSSHPSACMPCARGNRGGKYGEQVCAQRTGLQGVHGR
jgi:hypothetical protein